MKRVVIVGGGFGGVCCARTLRRKLPANACEVMVFDLENHLVFHPLLPEVAGGSIQPDAVAAPLRQMLPGVRCRSEEVKSIDPAARRLTFIGSEGRVGELEYDHVVIACGTRVNLGGVPGMADHAFPLKTLGDAIALRSHLMEQMERAEVAEASRRRWHLTFVVVGGGFSGVEVAGEINDLVRGSLRFFPSLLREQVSVTIVQGPSYLLPEIGPGLRRRAQAMMERAGVTLLLNTRVDAVTPQGVRLRDGRTIAAATVVSTIGNGSSPIVEGLTTPKDRGRLVTEADMSLPGHPQVWAVGDCASIRNARDGSECPPTGQFAERQGKQVAENIARVLAGQPTRAFQFRPLGQLCSIGGRRAVAEILGVRLSGFPAWFLWRGVYLAKIPAWSKRVRVAFDWAWDAMFARDLAHLRPDLTERVGYAYYPAGDFIFRQGDPANDLFVIEEGEVEVCHEGTAPGSAEVIALLGPGDFFGEIALIEDRPRTASVRARTAVKVVVMGRKPFDQICRSLPPLRNLVEGAARRRTRTSWLQLPEVAAALGELPLRRLVEPPPMVAGPDDLLRDAVARFLREGFDICCVVDGERRLQGILTRSDLLRVAELAASLPPEKRVGLKVGQAMVPNPVTVRIGDPSLLAAAVLRDHGLQGVPVLSDGDDGRLEGYVRVEKMMELVIR
jgi:NADH dehydrogenase